MAPYAHLGDRMGVQKGASASRRRAIQRGFRLARRLHLYFGLFMVPWVCLYGITALFFNHPDWLHPRTMTSFGADVLEDSPLAAPPDMDALAAAVHAELPGELSAPENIRWVGRYRLRGRDEANRYSLYAESDGRSGILYTTPLDVSGDHPLAELESVTVPFALSGDDTWATVETQLDVSTLALDRAPDLMFDVREGDVVWRIEYSPLSGDISSERLDERPSAPTIRSFLTRLHTQHVYPGQVSARWLWAILVDLMGAAMMFWGFTGLLMWWQIKKLRRVGGAVILGGVGSIALLAWSLYASLGF